MYRRSPIPLSVTSSIALAAKGERCIVPPPRACPAPSLPRVASAPGQPSAAAWFGIAGSLSAQDQPRRFTTWDLGIGEPAAAIPDESINHACGNDGGPPATRIQGCTDFRRCAADANGLHEVYFEYDDELEYRARALGRRQEINMYAGTTVFEFPIVASALFDEDGRVREKIVDDRRLLVAQSVYEKDGQP